MATHHLKTNWTKIAASGDTVTVFNHGSAAVELAHGPVPISGKPIATLGRFTAFSIHADLFARSDAPRAEITVETKAALPREI